MACSFLASLSCHVFFLIPRDPMSEHILFTPVKGFLELFLLSLKHLRLLFGAHSHFVSSVVRCLRLSLRVCSFCP